MDTSAVASILNARPNQPSDWRAFIDFDGTITTRDVLDELIVRYAVSDAWRDIELEWQRGEIGSYDCLRREFELIRIDAGELRRFLATVPLDAGTSSLFGTLRDHDVPFTILSDGIETFIRGILGRIGEQDIDVRSNRIAQVESRLSLICPHRDAACVSRSAHCKCRSAEQLNPLRGPTIYIGDGRSDWCASRHSDVIFAKGVLARLLTEQGRPFIPFQTLADVAETLRSAWAGQRASA